MVHVFWAAISALVTEDASVKVNHGTLFAFHNDEFDGACGAVFAAKGAADAVVCVYDVFAAEGFGYVCGCVGVFGGG